MRRAALVLLVLTATSSRGDCASDGRAARSVVLSCQSGSATVHAQPTGRRDDALSEDVIRCDEGDAGACVFTWHAECDVPEGACDDSIVTVAQASLITLGDGTTTVVFRCRPQPATL